jgi:hypothetical protein
MMGILNRDGKNEAVLEVNLDLLFDDQTPNASIYWAGDTQNEDARTFISPPNQTPIAPQKIAADIASRLMVLVS